MVDRQEDIMDVDSYYGELSEIMARVKTKAVLQFVETLYKDYEILQHQLAEYEKLEEGRNVYVYLILSMCFSTALVTIAMHGLTVNA